MPFPILELVDAVAAAFLRALFWNWLNLMAVGVQCRRCEKAFGWRERETVTGETEIDTRWASLEPALRLAEVSKYLNCLEVRIKLNYIQKFTSYFSKTWILIMKSTVWRLSSDWIILSPYRAVNTLRLTYKNQSVNAV
jgi:hypothetical protein